MKIEITNEQYKDLIKLVSLGNSVIGLLGDTQDDGGIYKNISNQTSKLENYLLEFAKDFGAEDMVIKFNNDENIGLHDDFYLNTIMPIIDDYEEYIILEGLSNKLARRDFTKKYTKEEIEEMRKRNNGFFGSDFYEYEKKYWDEFEANGYDNLYIKTD